VEIENDRIVRPWTEDSAILRINICPEDPDDMWVDLETPVFRPFQNKPGIIMADDCFVQRSVRGERVG
jgi:hypothetical protein